MCIRDSDGTATHSAAVFQELMARARPGQTIEMTYLRDGKRHSAKTTLRNNNGTTSISQPGDFTELGCALQPLGESELRRLGLQSGLQVSGLTDGKFRDVGIRKGFVILEVNGHRVRTVEEMEKVYDAVVKSASDDKVLFISGIYPTGRKTYYAVDLSAD